MSFKVPPAPLRSRFGTVKDPKTEKLIEMLMDPEWQRWFHRLQFIVEDNQESIADCCHPAFGKGAIIGGILNSSLGSNAAAYGSTTAPGVLASTPFIVPHALYAGKLHVNLSATETAGALSFIGFNKNEVYTTEGPLYGFTIPGLSPAGVYGDLVNFLRCERGNNLRFLAERRGAITSTYSAWSCEVRGDNNEGILGVTTNGYSTPLSSTVYLPVFGSSGETMGRSQFVVPLGCTFKNLWIKTGTAQSGTGSLVITVFKNGVATALTKTIAASSAIGIYTDLTNTVTFSAKDTITFQLTNNATAGAATILCIMLTYIPTSGKGRIIGGGSLGVARNAGKTSYSMPFVGWAGDGSIEPESMKRSIFPRAGVVSDLYAYVDPATPGTAPSSMKLSLVVNGVAVNPTLTFNGAGAGAIGPGTGTESVVVKDTFDMGYEVLAATPGLQVSWSAVIE